MGEASPVFGARLGRYRISGRIGAGGMGVVYRAWDDRLNRDVALKVLPPDTFQDERARRHFRQEALALSRLNHPHIESVYDFDSQDGVDFLVLELVSGQSLDQRLAQGALPPREVLRLGAQLAEGLAAAHDHGVVHCDLKPANLRCTEDGRLKILDFGLAKLRRRADDADPTRSLTGAGFPAGTLPYMAPEQLRGETVDARTDVYAAGAVLYEMATGQRAFGETRVPLLVNAILHEAPALPSRLNRGISAGVEQVIIKAMDKSPAHRYQSAREFGVDLRRLETPSSTPQLAARGRSRRWMLPVIAVVVLLLGLSIYALLHRGARAGDANPATIRSLAVLPLQNLSGDPAQEFFADGMTDELITDLGQIGALRVISRTSVMQYKGAHKPLPQIARELNVDGVIEGAVLRSGNRVRITAALVQAPAEQQIWSESYERDVRDVLALQNDVARAIVGEIRIKLTPQQQSSLTAERVVNPQAHEAYLRARFLWNQRMPDPLKKSLEYYRQAVELEPGNAKYWAGLADGYAIATSFGLLQGNYGSSQALAAARRALELNPNLAEAHAALAFILMDRAGDHAESEREYKRAIELNPNYSSAHHWYGNFLAHQGRFAEAEEQLRRGVELDPLSPAINTSLAAVYYVDRKYEQAIVYAEKVRDIAPDYPLALEVLADTNIQQHKLEEALRQLEELSRLPQQFPGEFAAASGIIYAATGRRREALAAIPRIREQMRNDPVNAAGFIALIYVQLRDFDRALPLLDEVIGNPESDLSPHDPLLDPIRPDPRFQALLRKYHVPQ